jgi:hypothetical protein
MATEPLGEPDDGLSVTVHIFVAFDWGDEIDLDRARQLAPSETHALPRERRTPPSIEYRPSPIRFPLNAWQPQWKAPVRSDRPATSDATVFDFGAVSVALHVPLTVSSAELTTLAASLADNERLIRAARAASEPLFKRLSSAITRPQWSSLSEEYVVIELHSKDGSLSPAKLIEQQARWLAGLVRLEPDVLSDSEVSESLKARMSYSPTDLVVIDWAGAVMIDECPGEILDLLAFANLQLLELRQINDQLESELETAWHVSRRHAMSWLPFWRSHARRVRALGMVKVDAHGMLERTSNILKLVGDPYLARVYQLLVARFRLDEWAANNRRSISVLESIYQVLTQQAGMYRAEFLELTIVLLIVFEILSQFWK